MPSAAKAATQMDADKTTTSKGQQGCLSGAQHPRTYAMCEGSVLSNTCVHPAAAYLVDLVSWYVVLCGELDEAHVGGTGGQRQLEI
jgi:hypothetical protein